MKSFCIALSLTIFSISALAQEQDLIGLSSVTTTEAAEMIQDNSENSEFVILDVRTLKEFKAGHLMLALNIDYFSNSFSAHLNILDKSKTYLVYCRSGNRSARAFKIMESLGFKNVYNMLGGIKEWKKEGRPTIAEEE